jgi:uncharacterized protein YbjT (DUF2867 family)
MWQAEQEVINSGLPYTILRPSLIFLEDFLGRNRLQPIAAEDAGRCIALTLADEFINALAALVKAFPLVPVVGRW